MPHHITLTLHLLPCGWLHYCFYWRIGAEDWYSLFLSVWQWGWPSVVKRNRELSLLISIWRCFFIFSSCKLSFFKWCLYRNSFLFILRLPGVLRDFTELCKTSIWTNPDDRARNETLISVPWRCNNAMLWWFTSFSLTRCGCTEHMNSSNSFYNDEVLEKAQNGAHGNVRWHFMPQTKIWQKIHNWLVSIFLSFFKAYSNFKSWAFTTYSLLTFIIWKSTKERCINSSFVFCSLNWLTSQWFLRSEQTAEN